MTYESLTTAKGKNPDVTVPAEKLIYEVRHLGLWEPGLDRRKIVDRVYHDLRLDGLRFAITLRFTHPIAFREQWKHYADLVVGTVRRMVQVSATTEAILLPNPYDLDDKPKLIVMLRGARNLTVQERGPRVFPTTSRAASTYARQRNNSVGALAAIPAGVTTVDYARAKAKSKLSQLESDWLGIIVLVKRVEEEPSISWDLVLEQLLEGDELLEVAVDGSSGPSIVQFPRTGLGGASRNRRLLGIIGCTINWRGVVVNFRGVRNSAHGSVPPSVETLFSTVVENTETTRLSLLVGGALGPFERAELL
jgi:hypothetical protein